MKQAMKSHKPMPAVPKLRPSPLALAIHWGLSGIALGGEVSTDGSLGAAGALSGPDYQIEANLGRQLGSNLFHSFARFNLDQAETATFNGPANIQNVLARVTQGASSIDGKIASTIEGANLYLVNPQGITFGPNAQLDVKGSFHATTADYVKLQDGVRFTAAPEPAADSALTSAPPQAFGFLDSAPASITVNGSQLAVPAGETLTLAGGNVEITNQATVSVWDGQINLISASAPSEIDVHNPHASGSPPTEGGTINIGRQSTVDAGGFGGGKVYIRGGRLTVAEGSSVRADTGWTADGAAVDIQLSGDLNLSGGSVISSNTLSSGNPHGISIKSRAGTVTLNDSGISSMTAGSGNAGAIALDVGSLDMNNALIFSNTLALQGGNAGNIDLTSAGAVILTGSSISSATSGSGNAGSLTLNVGHLDLSGSVIFSDTFASQGGHAGNIALTSTGSVTLNGSGISSATYGFGNAGAIALDVGSLDMNNALIFSNALALQGGNAGNIDLTSAGAVTLASGSGISSATYGSGNAGSLTLDVGSLNLSGSAIFSNAFAGQGGHAGNIALTSAGAVTLANSNLSSASSGSGDAGTITLDVGSLDMNNSWIFSDTNALQGGNAGAVAVTSAGAVILTGSSISSATFGNGNAGSLTLNVGSLNLSGSAIFSNSGIGSGRAGDIQLTSRGSVTFSAGNGNASSLSSATSGSGDAGTITLDVGSLDMNNSRIFSDTNALQGGNAGAVAVTSAGTVTLVSGSRISSATFGNGNAGSLTLNVGSLNLSGSAIFSNSGQALTNDTFLAGTGHAGNIALTSAGAVILTGSNLSSGTYGGGNAGAIALDVGSLDMDSSWIFSDTFASEGGDAGNIRVTSEGPITLSNVSFVSSETMGSGAGGTIGIYAQSLAVQSGSAVSTSTTSSGTGGDMLVEADDVLISGGFMTSEFPLPTGQMIRGRFSGLYLNSEGGSGQGGSLTLRAKNLNVENGGVISAITVLGSGNAGNLDIAADRISLASGAIISTSTSGRGNAGTIVVSADTLSISGVLDRNAFAGFTNPRVSDFSGITSTATRNLDASAPVLGNAGTVNISSRILSVSDNGEISTETEGAGRGGPIVVAARDLTLTNGGRIVADTHGSGAGGNIDVSASNLTVTNDAFISAGTSGTGRGGSLNIVADNVVLRNGGAIRAVSTGQGFDLAGNPDAGRSGDIRIRAADSIRLIDGGEISVKTEGANAGSIEIYATNLLHLHNGSRITTSAAGGLGNGGNIFIDPIFVILDGGSTIEARAQKGNGGNISIVANHFWKSPDSTVSASSEQGVSGVVVINSPLSYISGSLDVLPAVFWDSSALLRERCGSAGAASAAQASRLILGGRRPSPPGPDQTLYSLALLDRTDDPTAAASSALEAELLLAAALHQQECSLETAASPSLSRPS